MAVVVGTDKGAWVLERDGTGWAAEGPLFPGWRVTALGRAADGTYLAGAASGWFGPSVHTSPDLREWTQVEQGPRFAEGGPELEQIWTFATGADGRTWCGVAEAGLFTSDDGGRTWTGVEGFNDHPTRPAWQPGGGGMCAHRVILSGNTVWAAASAVGAFRSDDGGATFTPRNSGVGIAAPVEAGGPEGADAVGSCVHSLVAHPDDADVLWQQNHMGVYRTTDGGDSWSRIEQGLPSTFGFPMARDDASGALFVAPLEADVNRTPVAGRFGVYRSTDGGDSWHASGTGWPEEPTYDAVLRGAMSGDGDGVVVIGTSAGQLWATDDAGDRWQRLPLTCPRINVVAHL